VSFSQLILVEEAVAKNADTKQRNLLNLRNPFKWG